MGNGDSPIIPLFRYSCPRVALQNLINLLLENRGHRDRERESHILGAYTELNALFAGEPLERGFELEQELLWCFSRKLHRVDTNCRTMDYGLGTRDRRSRIRSGAMFSLFPQSFVLIP